MTQRAIPNRTTSQRSGERRLLRSGEAAERLYGSRSSAARARLMRLVEAGAIRSVRVGERQDHWFSSLELDRLLASAETEPVTEAEAETA